MVSELMILTPGMSFETILEFTWSELKRWHSLAICTYKTIHGIQ
ncbi:hypothetical protein [Treponema vincentii]|nr:hypothetical protein [Treponema vincentii]